MISPLIKTFSRTQDLRAEIATLRQTGSIGFVPTMGALHEGHLSLVRSLSTTHRVVSIYVNPLQFAAHEDLDKYPRQLDQDIKQLAKIGADILIFAPEQSEIHNPAPTCFVGHPLEDLDLCAKQRPGHFRGVLTILNHLLWIVQPDTLVLGEKDYQQLSFVKKLVNDFHIPCRVVGVPTMRDEDGLALSSRNRYLNPAERAVAGKIYGSLMKCREAFLEMAANTTQDQAEADLSDLFSEFMDTHSKEGQVPIKIEYVALRTDPDLLKTTKALSEDTHYRLLVAIKVGTTRLIDNIEIKRQ